MNSHHHTAYLAPLGFTHLLVDELKDITHCYERLILAKGPPQAVVWVQNIWFDPKFIAIESINDAANSLRKMQRNWWPYAFHHHRRMKLIEEKLPHVSAKPLEFLQTIPSAPLGSWTLLDENTILASAHCASPMPNGEWNFVEDKINPPSRAYLKLWEFFTRFRLVPSKSDVCLDLGASPGGWTYVLADLCQQVIAYDRSALDARVMALNNVTFIKKDAFKIKLSDHPEAKWIFSDVICFPEKLYDFIRALLKECPDKNYVFTIKFRGADHGDVIARFKKLPGELVHLSQNKHELTWFKVS